MKSDRRASQDHAILDAEEYSLRSRLAAVLPKAAQDGSQLFLNSQNAEPGRVRYSHEEADTLYASAVRCIELRDSLGMRTSGSIAESFLAACQEASSADPHRRGPRKLAEWVLSKIKS